MEQAVSVVDLEESTDLRQRMREQISLCQPMVRSASTIPSHQGKLNLKIALKLRGK